MNKELSIDELSNKRSVFTKNVKRIRNHKSKLKKNLKEGCK